MTYLESGQEEKRRRGGRANTLRMKKGRGESSELCPASSSEGEEDEYRAETNPE